MEKFETQTHRMMSGIREVAVLVEIMKKWREREKKRLETIPVGQSANDNNSI